MRHRLRDAARGLVPAVPIRLGRRQGRPERIHLNREHVTFGCQRVAIRKQGVAIFGPLHRGFQGRLKPLDVAGQYLRHARVMCRRLHRGRYRVLNRGLYRLCTSYSIAFRPGAKHLVRNADPYLAVVAWTPSPAFPLNVLPSAFALNTEALSEFIVGEPGDGIHAGTCSGL
ncbi:hypothetical protein OCOJLMKI_4534 [Methylobacterium iners]|uniref:Uncharacterized protein n=1 Tax=Methylobacterium iners TaxID=418707 RepID=A0ABQ4S6J9_9HYPH|nr:hypothetical protein OCOJLMKI_4534 [Methylobacterium iners]